MSENKTVRSFKRPIFLQYSKTLKVLSGRRHHIFKANMHDMARVRIRWLCPVVPFITGKEYVCSFYGVSGCKTLKLHAVKLSFSQILF